MRQTKKLLDFSSPASVLETFYSIATRDGFEGKFILSYETWHKLTTLKDDAGKKLYTGGKILGFPYEINDMLDHGVIIFEDY